VRAGNGRAGGFPPRLSLHSSARVRFPRATLPHVRAAPVARPKAPLRPTRHRIFVLAACTSSACGAVRPSGALGRLVPRRSFVPPSGRACPSSWPMARRLAAAPFPLASPCAAAPGVRASHSASVRALSLTSSSRAPSLRAPAPPPPTPPAGEAPAPRDLTFSGFGVVAVTPSASRPRSRAANGDRQGLHHPSRLDDRRPRHAREKRDEADGATSTRPLEPLSSAARPREQRRFVPGRSGERGSSRGGARRSVGVAATPHTRRSATESRRPGGGGLDAVGDRRDSPLCGADGTTCGGSRAGGRGQARARRRRGRACGGQRRRG